MSILRGIPVRWRVLFVLFVVSFVNYLLRNALSVAVPSIRSEFGFTSAEIGWIIGAFNISYTLMMIPGGVFGERYGPRLALGSVTVTWGVLTWFTGFAPGLMAASATGAMVSLIVVRLLVGATNAPIFPITTGLIEGWFPPGRWALPNSVTSSGLALGQAALGPIVTALIVLYGWREAFYILAPTGVIAGLWWYWYARDKPAQHPSITREEVEFIDAGRSTSPRPAAAPASWRAALVNRDVMILAASYFCLNYVFYTFSQWLFTYLVESRGLSMLESGWLYVLPFATGAVLTAVGGWVCDLLCRRLGGLRGCRITAMSGLVLVAFFLITGVFATDPYVAVGLLSLCFGFTLFADTPLLGRDDLCLGRPHGERERHAELRRHHAGPARAALRLHDRPCRVAADHRERFDICARRRRPLAFRAPPRRSGSEAMIDFPKRHRVPYDGRFSVDDLSTDPPKGTPSEDVLEEELKDLVDRLDALQQRLFADERFALLAVFQALDAAGKDSTIRKVFSGVNPAGFRVHAFGRPSELELRHDFLQRVAVRLPERGKIGVFNRSHYEEVLVVRVHPELLGAQRLPDVELKRIWKDRFESIRNFEEHLAKNGTVIVKFWLNVSRKEQKKRFISRIREAEKNWKFRLGDLDDRARWDDFQAAYQDALRETSRPSAPWYAIPADDKDYMRVAVARTLVETLERVDPKYPKLGAAERRDLKEGLSRLERE